MVVATRATHVSDVDSADAEDSRALADLRDVLGDGLRLGHISADDASVGSELH